MKPKPQTSGHHCRDCCGAEFWMCRVGDSWTGKYTNRPGKADFETTEIHVKKMLSFGRWVEIL